MAAPAQEIFTTTLFNDASFLAYYRLENVNDAKGTYTLTNNASVAFNPAKFNNGCDTGVANTTKYLSNSALNAGLSTNFSFSQWVKMNAEIGSSEQTFLYLGDNVTTHVAFEVKYQYNGGTQRLYFNRRRESISNDGFTYNFVMGTSAFQCLGLTYDGAVISGYVNGTLAGTSASSGLGTTGNEDTLFYIAKGRVADSNTNANIIGDDYALFTRVLSSTEMANIANGSLTTRFGGGFLLNFL